MRAVVVDGAVLVTDAGQTELPMADLDDCQPAVFKVINGRDPMPVAGIRDGPFAWVSQKGPSLRVCLPAWPGDLNRTYVD